MKYVKQSFTLVEILVVIVIIGILSGFIFFTINDSVEKASIAKSKMFSESIRNNLLLNLVSEWKLDGNTNDSWGSNNGTWHGSGSGAITSEAYLPESQCISGQCMEFDGIDDYIDCGNSSSVNITDEITLSAWVKIDDLTVTNCIVSKYQGTPYSWQFCFTSSLGIYFYADTSIVFESGANSIEKDKWYNVVVNYKSDTSQGKLYLNSIPKDETANIDTLNANNLNLIIGARSDSKDYPFDGAMDEIQMYNALISETAIKQNYLSGLNNLYAKGLITEEEYGNRLSLK
jgi:prepilin-type N-terminal cleavage/methylation domain-containing protein